jgi:type III restriction enzyme
MALTPDFPKSPFEILDPSLRWFPADESLRESSAEKLMPPLVSAIRIKVHEFRAANYAGASKTSKSLLNWWFKTPHPIVGSNPEEYFNYFFSQREAIEAIIYLHDVEQVVNQNELLEFDGHGLLTPESFAENWRRYVLKLATGAGKTKVLSLALTWSYFHKMYEENSDMARNFLIIAPNIIVLDRLRVDFEGLKIFKDDPLIPEDGFEGQDWNSDFKVDLFVQDETNVKSRIGNIFLTNIQRVYDRQEKGYSADDDNSEDYFLGSTASSNAAGKNYDLSSIVADVDELVVLNDEAHHIHDEGLAWYRSIERLHLNLLQKNSRLSMQIDVTATPKHQNGAIFAQTICDYPLVEAIAQNVVKTPVLPDILSRSRLKEINSSKFSQRYADYLRLGVEEWRKSFNIHWKMNKKSVLFIMTDDTKNCDDVAEWLEENYPTEFDGKVLTIHTKKNGEISESTSGKGKEELESLRKQAREIDRIDNPFRAIVSVLMLKEGWDVRNVTTIVGLRPFTASANILPEQALGRGLRRMYTRDADVQEYVSVVGTEAFMDFVESIKSEGVTLEHKPMNKDSEATGPRVVEIDQENLKKDMDSLDIQIPVLSPKLKKEYKRLEELDLKSLDFKPLIIKKFSEEQLREIVFGEIVEGKEHHRTLLKSDAPADWRFVIKFFTERILKELRLFKGYDTLYPLVKEFCAEMIFGKSVNLEEEIVLKNLSEIEARRTIEETFKKAINSLTIHESGETEVRDTISVRKTRPFVINDSEFYRPNKSVFNIISGDSILELRFAALLDNCADVVSFGKNYFAVNFKLDYLNADGVISYYYPDFLVKLKPSQGKEELYVVETKGREDLDDPLKFSRLEQWIKDVNSIPGAKQIWNALYVSQETFDKNRDDYRSFADLVAEFKDSRPKTTKSA